MRTLVCAVDVGTTSARAAILDGKGVLLGRADRPIVMRRDGPDIAEHDSEDIWLSVCRAVRAARDQAGAEPGHIAAIAFDATCSLVIRGRDGGQASLHSSEGRAWDTIAWLDHRAQAEADECTETDDAALASTGGVMSPEMQIPKLMWLKRHRPDVWEGTGHLFDLADFLSWKASGSPDRSHCTLACKWTFQSADRPGWNREFLDRAGLGDVLARGRLPETTRPVGADIGPLTEEAAEALGLTTLCRVGVGMIDAFAGALGVLGGLAASPTALQGRAALVAGTSSCVMLFSADPVRFAGVWGPYRDVVLPGLFVSEGGQSATGGLLDHIIRWHGAAGQPDAAAHRRIAVRIAELRAREGNAFAARLHVLPDFHGNRSPFADPHALGVVSGLRLDASFDSLCRLYWRTAVGIALGVRQIVETIQAVQHPVTSLHLAGGHMRNQMLTQLYADVTGRVVVEPAHEDAVLLGTGMAAAAAAGLYPDLAAAARSMQRSGLERLPEPAASGQFDRDYRIFLEMHRQRRVLDAMT
jgi:FGGY-family pentulose kinase